MDQWQIARLRGWNMSSRAVGYLGPQGTWAEEAALRLADGRPLVPLPGIVAVLAAVEAGTMEEGVVPIENSIEGGVNLTLDRLAMAEDLRITGEWVLPIHHVLMAAPGSGEIRRILSHPQALAQCQHTLARRFPGAEIRETTSTARAAQEAASDPEAAAIGSARAAVAYGLQVIAEDLADHPGNATRFVRIGRESPLATGHDKTSLVFSLAEDQPGGLWECLGEFARRHLNLSRVESRPAKSRLGQYLFFLDTVGHREDREVAAAMEAIAQRSSYFRWLGSYPRADWQQGGGQIFSTVSRKSEAGSE